jgi:hypothetical protein
MQQRDIVDLAKLVPPEPGKLGQPKRGHRRTQPVLERLAHAQIARERECEHHLCEAQRRARGRRLRS